MRKRIPLVVRKHLTEHVAKYAKKDCCVMLSSGIDSHSVLFSCLEAGIKPVTTSFTLEDRESRDFVSARYTASKFNLEFRPVILSTDLTRLKKYLLAICVTGVSGKAAYECLWPFIETFRKVEEDVVFTGYATDLFFALTKKGSMHYRDDVSTYAMERRKAYLNKNSQMNFLSRYANKLGFEYSVPWFCDGIKDQYLKNKYTYYDVNEPRQKQPIRDQYKEELKHCKVYNHTNAQLGDSGIALLYKNLLKDEYWNKNKYKSVVGIYNSIARGEITQIDAPPPLGILWE